MASTSPLPFSEDPSASSTNSNPTSPLNGPRYRASANQDQSPTSKLVNDVRVPSPLARRSSMSIPKEVKRGYSHSPTRKLRSCTSEYWTCEREDGDHEARPITRGRNVNLEEKQGLTKGEIDVEIEICAPLKKSASMCKLSQERNSKIDSSHPPPPEVQTNQQSRRLENQNKSPLAASRSPLAGSRSPLQNSYRTVPPYKKNETGNRSLISSSATRAPQCPPSMFDTTRPGLFVCHRNDRTKILESRTCSEYRGVFRSVAQALCKACHGDIINVAGGIYEESFNVSICVCIRALPGEDVTFRTEDESLITSEACFAKFERVTMEHSGGDVLLRGLDGPRCVRVTSGELSLEDCKINSSTGSGVMVCDCASVIIRRCDVSCSERCGLLCLSGGKAICEDSSFSNNKLNGIDIQSGSSASARSCRVEENGQTGVLVSDDGSFVSLQEVVLLNNVRRGVTAQNFGVVSIDNSSISGSDMGIFVMGDESLINASIISRNKISGNKSGAIFIHGLGPTVKDNVTEGKVVAPIPGTPPVSSPLGQRFPSGDLARSPVMNARRLASSMVIQCSWRAHAARRAAMSILRRKQELILKQYQSDRTVIEVAKSTAAKAASSAVKQGPPEFRAAGMAALEADVLDTFKRFDRLECQMGAILAQSGM